MKVIFVFILVWFTCSPSHAWAQQKPELRFVDASELTLIGKAYSTVSEFHRVDTSEVKGLTASENQQARSSSGLALTFRTNSSIIELLPTYIWKAKKDNVTGIAAAGFDLYIKRQNQWTYAGTAGPVERAASITIVKDMDTSEKECLLYLPIYSELSGLKIGVQKDAIIKANLNPFKKKVVFFGSSFTQGIGASRPGMSYPMQVERGLGIEVCNLGFSGNSKLQPYFAKMLGNVKADAIVLDAFSNPSAAQIQSRLVAFVDSIVKKHPTIPLIFVQTIYRAKSNFNLKSRQFEADKKKVASELMVGILRKYSNVYLIENPLPEGECGDSFADGVHPSDLGYSGWATNLSGALSKILSTDINKINKN